MDNCSFGARWFVMNRTNPSLHVFQKRKRTNIPPKSQLLWKSNRPSKEYFPLEFHSRLQEFILKTIPKTLIMVVVLTIPMSKPWLKQWSFWSFTIQKETFQDFQDFTPVDLPFAVSSYTNVPGQGRRWGKVYEENVTSLKDSVWELHAFTAGQPTPM